MVERPTAPRIGNVAAPVSGADIAETMRRVSAPPVYVDVVFAGTVTAYARHGLGRPYVGGTVIGATQSHTSAIVVVLPSVASATHDITKYVLVDAGAAYTGTVRLQVL
jgi:hypothetical protein